MPNLLIAGSGRIGITLASLLASHDNYHVDVVDLAAQTPAELMLNDQLRYYPLDITDEKASTEFIVKQGIQSIVVCLPYYLNLTIAKLAKKLKLNYFDLSEDVASSQAIEKLAHDCKQAFVCQCGVAPGLINIIAEDLIHQFDTVDSVKLRCGALPQSSNNALHYALMWSVDGLINEYCNPCPMLKNGKLISVPGLSGLEALQIEGCRYEAFHTSGGLGPLIDSHQGKIQHLSYKTIRYPGHAKLMRFLINDLKLSNNREMLKQLLVNALPMDTEDWVLVYVTVSGFKNDCFIEKSYINKFYPQQIAGQHFSAIQMVTASSACATIECVLSHPQQYQGFVRQNQFSLSELLKGHFGEHLAK